MSAPTAQRFRARVAVYGVLKRDGMILLARRFNTGYADGLLSLPAGHLDGGEHAIAALVRELREELGIEACPETIELATVMHRNDIPKHHGRERVSRSSPPARIQSPEEQHSRRRKVWMLMTPQRIQLSRRNNETPHLPCAATHLSCGNGRIGGMGNDRIERSERLAKWLTDGNYGDGMRFRGMIGTMDDSPPRECDRELAEDMALSMNRDLHA